MQTAEQLEVLCEQLNLPQPIEAAEKIEAELKKPWLRCLRDGFTEAERLEFSDYFSKIGFIHKYKSYGTKFAAPFGYSLFDLNNNEGFSVQIHEEEKVEAFHILGTKPASILLLGSADEWRRLSNEFIDNWTDEPPSDLPMTISPKPGDVAIVSNLSTVHTVVGAVMEEYATTSYDAVTRLHDQNQNRAFKLAEEHQSVADLLSTVRPIKPRRLLSRSAIGWEMSSVTDTIVDLYSYGLKGGHVRISERTNTQQVPDDRVLTLAALDGETMIHQDGGNHQLLLAQGDTTALAPGAAYELVNSSILDESIVALCEVPTRTAVLDLRQLG